MKLVKCKFKNGDSTRIITKYINDIERNIMEVEFLFDDEDSEDKYSILVSRNPNKNMSLEMIVKKNGEIIPETLGIVNLIIGINSRIALPNTNRSEEKKLIWVFSIIMANPLFEYFCYKDGSFKNPYDIESEVQSFNYATDLIQTYYNKYFPHESMSENIEELIEKINKHNELWK